MNQLIIIGAGGMGRTLYDTARESLGYGQSFIIKGFIDDNLDALDNFSGYPPVLGTIAGYIPLDNDCFVCAIGGEIRKECIQSIVTRGGRFFSLIHKTARIGTNAKIGVGNIIGAFTTIGPDVVIGDYNMIQSYSVIGHDVKIGNWNRIDTHVTCVGGVEIANETTIHTSAVISHKVRVLDKAHVGACSFVIKKVDEGTTVFGNPARKLI